MKMMMQMKKRKEQEHCLDCKSQTRFQDRADRAQECWAETRMQRKTHTDTQREEETHTGTRNKKLRRI